MSLTKHAKINILQQQKKYKQRYDHYRINPVYKINDLVLIQVFNRQNKFDIRYEGPYRIIQKLGQKTYIVRYIKNSTLTRQVTIDVIRPVYERKNIYN